MKMGTDLGVKGDILEERKTENRHPPNVSVAVQEKSAKNVDGQNLWIKKSINESDMEHPLICMNVIGRVPVSHPEAAL